MKHIIYLLEKTGSLRRQNETLVFEEPDGTRRIFHPHRIEQLIIAGNVQITTPAFKLLLKHSIPVTFLSTNGKFYGKLTFREPKNVFLRMTQYRRHEDPSFQLACARHVVGGKVQNQRTFLQRMRRTRQEIPGIATVLARLDEVLTRIPQASSVDELRGLEGLASRHYFSVFGYNILPEWAVFQGRTRNPPRDNVNAVLSFLYTLLFHRIALAIETESLDPYVGFFHAVEYGKMSLAFDLMEEFRVPLGDMVCCALFNLGTLTPEDFREAEFSAESDEFLLEEEEGAVETPIQGILLTSQGLRKVVEAFERRLDEELFIPTAGKRLSYRQVIHHQVKEFRAYLQGERAEYSPLVIK